MTERTVAGGARAERALRRLLRAEAAFERSQARSARLRVKLGRAEEKLARRAEQVDAARAALLETTDLAQASADRESTAGAADQPEEGAP